MSQGSSAAPAVTLAKNSTRKKVILVVAILLVVAGLAVGIPYGLYARSHAWTDDAFIAAHITPLASRVSGHVVKVHVRDNQWVSEGDLLVELDPADYEAGLAKAKGMLDSANARLESAKAQAKLVTITAYASQDEAASAVKLAESALQTSKARVSSAKTRKEQSEAAVAVAKASAEESRAEVKASEAQAEFDEVNLKRYEDMFKGEAVTKQELDRATAVTRVSRAVLQTTRSKVASAEAKVTQAEAADKGAEDGLHETQSQGLEAEAALDQAKARLAAAKSAPEKVLVSVADVSIMEAQVKTADAAVREAELALSYCRVKAPVAGRVTSKAVNDGAYVMTGQSLLAIVPADVWVVANFKETDLTGMAPGQPVEILVDAYPDVKFAGRVDSLQAGTGAAFALLPPENASGNYIKVVQRVPVKIVFVAPLPDLARYHLAPGMSVVPTVDISTRPQEGERPAPSVKHPGETQPARAITATETPS